MNIRIDHLRRTILRWLHCNSSNDGSHRTPLTQRICGSHVCPGLGIALSQSCLPTFSLQIQCLALEQSLLACSYLSKLFFLFPSHGTKGLGILKLSQIPNTRGQPNFPFFVTNAYGSCSSLLQAIIVVASSSFLRQSFNYEECGETANHSQWLGRI